MANINARHVGLHFPRLNLGNGDWHTSSLSRCACYSRPEANIIKKKDKLLGRFIPYLTCKIRNKYTQYIVLKKHDI